LHLDYFSKLAVCVWGVNQFTLITYLYTYWNFHRHNPSNHTMALGLTQPLTEMSTRSISWGSKAAGT